jgi:N-acetylmuramoyl-L-alanine amidase
VRDITHIILHHSASPLSTTAADVAAWHTNRGWDGCGYHLVIESSGEAILGREIGRTGAHVKGHNAHSIGICLVGDNTTASQRWVWQQIKALEGLLRFFDLLFPDAVVLGHRDVPGTATLCPGLDVRELLGLSPLAVT